MSLYVEDYTRGHTVNHTKELAMSLEALIQYVREHTARGACHCGKCFDNKEDAPVPDGHTVNLTLFTVGLRGQPSKEKLQELISTVDLEVLGTREVSYIELGGVIGDQGTALQLIGLGHLLGLWFAASPHTMLPSLDEETKQNMAGHGYVSAAPNPTTGAF